MITGCYMGLVRKDGKTKNARARERERERERERKTERTKRRKVVDRV